jgi:hypothetical protein
MKKVYIYTNALKLAIGCFIKLCISWRLAIARAMRLLRLLFADLRFFFCFLSLLAFKLACLWIEESAISPIITG